MVKTLYGILAGLLSALTSLILAYVVGVAAIAADTREFFPTLLAGFTALPLMLLFVLLLPTLVIGLLTGLTIGITANATSRVYLIGPTAGVLFSLLVLSGVLPLLTSHAPDDFVSIVSQPFRTAVYGLVLGLIASLILSKMNATSTR